MSKPGNTFSESWHRIAQLKVSLGPAVKVRKQIFRGETWYVVYDPFNNNFFRLRPEAYDFISHLRTDRTVEEIWEEGLKRNPDDTPGQEDVLQLLTQLYYSNLLYFEMPADSAKLFERYKKRRQREIQSKLLSIMFIRIPLFDPENLLKRLLPFIRLVFSGYGAVLWLLVVGFAGKSVFDRFDMAVHQVQGILAPDNLFLLYIGVVLVKSLHEFGHAMTCRRFGGEVHTMGVMLLIFTPLPYMDATSSWSFRSRWQRALVGASGMIMEIFAAGIATFVWAYTGAGTLHSLAYNIMFIASISTLLFNANPLLRFDGYYILSDLLDIPNLTTRAMQHLRHLAERYLFGCRNSFSPAQTGNEAFFLTVFSILSGIYRIVVFTGIILFVADKFLLAGLVMAVICVISWGIMPPYRLVRYLAASPRIAKTRFRAIGVSVTAAAILVFFLAVCPFPKRFRAPGILEAVNYVQVVNKAPGYVKSVFVAPGSKVTLGMPLIQLGDTELGIELKRAKAQKDEVHALLMKARSDEIADLKPLRSRLETIEKKLEDLGEQEANLIVRARQDGIWMAPPASELKGTWVPKGAMLGEIVDHRKFRFSTVVNQDDAANLFAEGINRVDVRLYGHEGINIKAGNLQIIPFQHEKLPSAALGWYAGGEVAVSASDDTGLQASEPFFQIYADVIPDSDVLFLHGRAGKLRFSMDHEPLLVQLWQGFLRLLQKRYQI
ncbi:MAG: hypothetical protein JRI86_08735 [Deltaproteobacteria bacterium]|nr:hypothetical protein [Deltaproteobacteria bacterium]